MQNKCISFGGQFLQDLPSKMRVVNLFILNVTYFEGLSGLNLVNSRGFAFCRRSGA